MENYQRTNQNENVTEYGSLEMIKRVTLKTADALLIANYFTEKETEWLK